MTKVKKPISTPSPVDYPNRKQAASGMLRRKFLALLGGCGAAVIGSCSGKKTMPPPADRTAGEPPLPSNAVDDTPPDRPTDPPPPVRPPDPPPPVRPPVVPTAGVPRRPDPNSEPEPTPETPVVIETVDEEEKPRVTAGRMRMPHSK